MGAMESATERRRTSRIRKTVPQTLRIVFEDLPGRPKTEIIGKLVDTSESGLCVDIASALGVGSLVFVDGQIVRAPTPGLWAARVRWCRFNSHGAYSAGLHLEGPAHPSLTIEPEGKPFQDYYDLLQLSAKADPDTIHRVYRMLAQRYHPDNPDTGSEELFKGLLHAYKVLSDPEQRAAYDVRHQSEQRVRWKIFNQPEAAQGREAQRRQRQGLLSVLYTRRVNEPAQPTMSIHEFEDLLGCPREHLEFSLWYLKERGWIGRTDNGRYSISAAGVEQAEAGELMGAREDRLLPSASH
jgi:curved DNA-binding protein